MRNKGSQGESTSGYSVVASGFSMALLRRLLVIRRMCGELWLSGVTPSAEYEALQEMEWEEILRPQTSRHPDRQREVVKLWADRYKQVETCGMLGTSQANISSHLRRTAEKIAALRNSGNLNVSKRVEITKITT